MANSLETRIPFLNHRIVELAARVPSTLHADGQQGKRYEYRLAEAPSHGTPVLKYDQSSRGAIAYLALAGELVRREQERRAGLDHHTAGANEALPPDTAALDTAEPNLSENAD